MVNFFFLQHWDTTLTDRWLVFGTPFGAISIWINVTRYRRINWEGKYKSGRNKSSEIILFLFFKRSSLASRKEREKHRLREFTWRKLIFSAFILNAIELIDHHITCWHHADFTMADFHDHIGMKNENVLTSIQTCVDRFLGAYLI